MAESALQSALDTLGMSQSAFARLLQTLGDYRSFPTILRSISNQCRGATNVSGEMMVIINLLMQAKQRPEVEDQATEAA